jgi:hypothetical protein
MCLYRHSDAEAAVPGLSGEGHGARGAGSPADSAAAEREAQDLVMSPVPRASSSARPTDATHVLYTFLTPLVLV